MCQGSAPHAPRIGARLVWMMLAWLAPLAAHAQATRPTLQAQAELGAAQIDEDTFLALSARLGLRLELPAPLCAPQRPDCRTALNVSLQAPLRLRLVDRDPTSAGRLRAEDWDETRDIGRIIQRLAFGEPGDALVIQLGQVADASLGRGVLLHRYHNVISPDYYKLGLRAELEQPWWGLSLLMDEALSPNLIAARLHIAPVASLDLGVSGVTDLNAPTRLSRDAELRRVVGPGRLPVVLDAARTTAWSLDADYTLWRGERLALSALADLAWHDLIGRGAHLGARLLWAGDDLSAALTADLSLAWGGYTPRYFGPLYEIDRYQTLGFGQALPAPRLRVAASLDQRAARNAAAELRLDYTPLDLAMIASASRALDLSAADTLTVSAQLRPLDTVQLAAFYHYQGDLGAITRQGALLSSEARVDLSRWLYLVARLDALWRLRDDGVYEPSTLGALGLGTSIAF